MIAFALGVLFGASVTFWLADLVLRTQHQRWHDELDVWRDKYWRLYAECGGEQ